MFASKAAKPPAKSGEGPTGRSTAERSRRVESRARDRDERGVSQAAPSAGWDFSGLPVSPPEPPDPPQPGLAVGRADDPLEHEAHRIADHVMRMPEPASGSGPIRLSHGN